MYFLLHSFMFPLCFTVLLEHLRRLYGYSSIFKCCQCIITATAPATLAVATVAALTPDYEVLTNQGDAPVSVYIDSVALQLNLSHHSNEHRILYVLRALNTTPLCHLVTQTVTVIILLKYVTWSIYTETNVPLISQCFVSRGLVR
jgi:hypothetical protein